MEAALTESQKEMVYALMGREKELQQAGMRLRQSVDELSKMLGAVHGLEAEKLALRVSGDQVYYTRASTCWPRSPQVGGGLGHVLRNWKHN